MGCIIRRGKRSLFPPDVQRSPTLFIPTLDRNVPILDRNAHKSYN